MADLIEKIQTLVAENKSLKELAKKNEQENKSLKSDLYTKQGHNDLILRARMKKMGVNYDHFKSIFEVKDTIMAGGLITQIMTGDNWQTDIDIFTTNPTEVVRRLNMVEGWMSSPQQVTNSDDANYPTSFVLYQGKYFKNVSVDIIKCRTVASAVREFDLDFIKCYFDGKNFHVHNERAVITKTHEGYTDASNMRCTKYTMRGFKITPKPPTQVITRSSEQLKSLEKDNIETIMPTVGESPRKVCGREGCPFHKC
jgi:hypothetical protein